MVNHKSVVSKTRNSNIELFRIVSTLLVLVVHFNGWFVGGLPNSYDLQTFSVQEGVQLYIQGLSCCCVNCFLVISGWYGVKLKFSSIWKIWLILISVYVPCCLVNCYINQNFSFRELADSIVAFSRESYYIQNYLILVFISPMLNSFVEKFGQRITSYVLTFWAIEFIMEYLCRNRCLYIEHGYSLFHFVIMYLLARTAYLNKEILLRLSWKWYLLLYFVIALVIACGRGIFASSGPFVTAYSNPLNVVEAFCLFFCFVQLNFNNKAVNYIASATLTVYVLQVTTPVFERLKEIDMCLLNNFSYGVYLALALCTIICFFLISTLYAKIMESIVGHLFSPLGIYLKKKISNFFVYE